jgi:hypothetical protein
LAALLYTLFESARLASCNPHAYRLEATRRAIAAPGTATLPEDLTSSDSAEIPSHSPKTPRTGSAGDLPSSMNLQLFPNDENPRQLIGSLVYTSGS